MWPDVATGEIVIDTFGLAWQIHLLGALAFSTLIGLLVLRAGARKQRTPAAREALDKAA